jgi:hypothetical protein
MDEMSCLGLKFNSCFAFSVNLCMGVFGLFGVVESSFVGGGVLEGFVG